MRGLSLFRKTSVKSFNIASWHSPHSLTWSWILAVRQNPLWTLKPYCFMGEHMPGLSLGFGQLIAFCVRKDNNGWQGSIGLLWHSLDWHRQQPMWYRDLYMRKIEDEEIAKGWRKPRAA